MGACQGVHDLGPHTRSSPANEAIVAGRVSADVGCSLQRGGLIEQPIDPGLFRAVAGALALCDPAS